MSCSSYTLPMRVTGLDFFGRKIIPPKKQQPSPCPPPWCSQCSQGADLVTSACSGQLQLVLFPLFSLPNLHLRSSNFYLQKRPAEPSFPVWASRHIRDCWFKIYMNRGNGQLPFELKLKLCAPGFIYTKRPHAVIPIFLFFLVYRILEAFHGEKKVKADYKHFGVPN